MKNIKTLNKGEQVFENYSAEDREVWRTLYNRQLPNFKYFSQHYLDAIAAVGLDDGNIPNFKKIENVLQGSTGWRLSGVEEIVDLDGFLDLMKKRCFPATTWIREMSQLDYLEEPDMFHDVLGHVPLLNNSNFANFLQALGAVGHEFCDDEQALIMVQRMYWFTVEFGLIDENGVKGYGAGIISSPAEIEHAMGAGSEKRPFDVEEIMDTDFRTDVLQSVYYVIDSLEQLYESIDTVREVIMKRAAVFS